MLLQVPLIWKFFASFGLGTMRFAIFLKRWYRSLVSKRTQRRSGSKPWSVSFTTFILLHWC